MSTFKDFVTMLQKLKYDRTEFYVYVFLFEKQICYEMVNAI